MHPLRNRDPAGCDDTEFTAPAVVPQMPVRQPSTLIRGSALKPLSEQMEPPNAGPQSMVSRPELAALARAAA
ncbi:hypothetical protein [Arthrobacter sp. N199823]|uniref:hypothetical protein n=1 Tax=Arthrobacter sp. N199823 TaxID=2058895 RepID=UPI000CE405B4|nr:hypothetical protein [Arthrobacter sp. N199823]